MARGIPNEQGTPSAWPLGVGRLQRLHRTPPDAAMLRGDEGGIVDRENPPENRQHCSGAHSLGDRMRLDEVEPANKLRGARSFLNEKQDRGNEDRHGREKEGALARLAIDELAQSWHGG